MSDRLQRKCDGCKASKRDGCILGKKRLLPWEFRAMRKDLRHSGSIVSQIKPIEPCRRPQNKKELERALRCH